MSASAIPAGQLSLSGPSERLDTAHWPVRGDLAHVALAGKVFVPHYAVPMPHELREDAELKQAPRLAATTLDVYAAGARFDVLDMAGDWAWGQAEENGKVGYFRLDQLSAL